MAKEKTKPTQEDKGKAKDTEQDKKNPDDTEKKTDATDFREQCGVKYHRRQRR